jgi:hypothetical protein
VVLGVFRDQQFLVIGETQHEIFQVQKLEPQMTQISQMGADPTRMGPPEVSGGAGAGPSQKRRDPGAPAQAHAHAHAHASEVTPKRSISLLFSICVNL